MILLFGGNGQLGQEITREAANHGIPIAALSRAQADIAEAEQVSEALRLHRPGIVVNAAAYTNVDQAEDEYDLAMRANAHGPTVVAAACKAAELPFIHISTDYVFDGSKTEPYIETDPIAPIGAYGRSKAAGEDMVRAATPMHVILRTAWVYGEFGKNFLKTILRLASERDELRVVADQRGNPTSTREIARTVLSLAPRLKNKAGPWGTYHFAGGGITTWYGFAEWIVRVQARHTQREPRIVPISSKDYPTRAKRPANSALNCDLFARVFGMNAAPWRQESERVIDSLLRA